MNWGLLLSAPKESPRDCLLDGFTVDSYLFSTLGGKQCVLHLSSQRHRENLWETRSKPELPFQINCFYHILKIYEIMIKANTHRLTIRLNKQNLYSFLILSSSLSTQPWALSWFCIFILLSIVLADTHVSLNRILFTFQIFDLICWYM